MSNKAVANKIIEAWKHVGSIPKNGRNPKFNYSFVREEDAADALRNAFIKVGLSCVPSVERLDRSIIKTSSGAEMQHVIVTMKFTLTDKDTGEIDTFTMVGEAADSFDKAVYKAITGCTKYAYVKLAMSGAEDNEDEDAGERAEHPAKPAGAKPVPPGTTYRKPDQPAPTNKPSGSTTTQPKGIDKKPVENHPEPTQEKLAKTETTPIQESQGTDTNDQIPIMEGIGHITAVIPAMKGKPASLSFKSDDGSVLAITFDPKTINVPTMLKLQASKAKVAVRCDISSGQPHLMLVEGV